MNLMYYLLELSHCSSMSIEEEIKLAKEELRKEVAEEAWFNFELFNAMTITIGDEFTETLFIQLQPNYLC